MTAALTLFLALLLAVSAGHKLLARDRLAIAAARLAGAPDALGPTLLLAAAAIELLSAALLMVPALRSAGALAAAALWIGYAIALFARRGQTVDCGCDLTRRERPLRASTALRPLALAATAVACAIAPADTIAIDAPFAALALLALYFAMQELAALPPAARNREGRRT